MLNHTTFKAAREYAVKQLDYLLKTSRNHPNPEDGKHIRIVCTRAILNINVANSTGQIADIFKKAEAELKAKIKPAPLFDKAA